MILLPIELNPTLNTQFADNPESQSILEVYPAYYLKVGFTKPWIGYFASIDGREIVGCGGFKGKPQEGKIEIAYGTFKNFQGQGIGTEICRQLVLLSLETDPSIRITARTLMESNASTKILQRNGFQYVEVLNDEDDGNVWEWEYRKENNISPSNQSLKPTTLIRKADAKKDFDAVWKIFSRVIQTGDTYVFDPNTPKESLITNWFADYMNTFVAVNDQDQILGTYIIKPNQIGLGDHIANCGYMVNPEFHGRGIGTLLCEHSLRYAKEKGYLGIQFNIVVSTNTHAVKLWQKFGFQIIGTTPKGFRHKELGLVDTYIMFKDLQKD